MSVALKPSRLAVGKVPEQTILDYFVAHFPHISSETWQGRFARGMVLNADKQAQSADAPIQSHRVYYYFREVEDEIILPFQEQVIYEDEFILVVDKPHYLPVTPSGPYLRETLLGRQQKRLKNTELSPVHRLDRETAGLVLFTKEQHSRGKYQALFRERQIVKKYHAIAPLLDLKYPFTVENRLASGPHFLKMQVVDGVPNSKTIIDLLEAKNGLARYQLSPTTGQKHQLRVHLHSLGAAIVNDRLYPDLYPANPDDYRLPPLQLLAKELSFIDPMTQQLQHFQSRLGLDPAYCK